MAYSRKNETNAKRSRSIKTQKVLYDERITNKIVQT
jgi:hypothetical protein